MVGVIISLLVTIMVVVILLKKMKAQFVLFFGGLTLLVSQNLGFRSCRRRRKTVDLLVAQANPGHSRG